MIACESCGCYSAWYLPECDSVLVECFHGVHSAAWRLTDFTRMSIPPLLNLCLKMHRQLSIPDWLGKIPVDGHPTQYRWNPVTGKKAK
jgi:hypothetical protein